jgi:hypothetical protein
MTLIFDERNRLQGKPGLHALIVGVSLYRHLPGGGGEPADESYGMQQLSSAALAAYKVYRWLLDHRDGLPLPLATVRLLLSPSPTEQDAEPEMENLEVEGCTRAALAAEAKRWRKDASLHRDGSTFFYFAGHGVQRKKDDAVMLLEDFGDPDEGPLMNAVATENLFHGMAPPSDPSRQIAQRQIYFVDACRIAPSEFRDYQWQNVPDLWPVELAGRDDRSAPIFFAAIPGSRAYGLPGQQTLFSKALLACLNDAGAQALDEEDTWGEAKWGVTVYSLNRALTLLITKLNEDLGGDQDYVLSGLVKDAVLRYLDGPPDVDVRLEINPTDALPFVRLEVTDPENRAVWHLEPVDPHPYEDRLQAGFYWINASINPPKPPYRDRIRLLREVKPPHWSFKAKVGP